MNFSEAFIAWIHIKALRVFVESVLRYCDQKYNLTVTHAHNHSYTELLFDFIVISVMCSFRYGLPVNFQAMLLQPTKKTMKRLREVLNDLYKHLDSSAASIIDVSTDNIV